MRRISLFISTLSAVLLFSACSGGGKTVSISGGSSIEMCYADNLKLTEVDGCVVAQLRNPWDTTKTLHTYILVERGCNVPADAPEGTVVTIPLSNAVVYSSVHCSLLNRLGAIDCIGGVCDLNYIKLPEIQERCRSGRIVDMGNGQSPDIEKLIDLNPDAIMLSPFENSGGYGRVEKLNIPIIECADYMETSPLGRAEWMRFYGMLFGKIQQSDSLFKTVEDNYVKLKTLASGVDRRPTVLSEMKNSAAWYVPGGRSAMAILFADAGADYVFASDSHSGSVPMAFESVYDRGQNADFWLIKYHQNSDKTYSELKRDFAPYAGFNAYRRRNIYACNTAHVSFYEEFPFHPDWLLSDMIKIFHPELIDNQSTRYYTKLSGE